MIARVTYESASTGKPLVYLPGIDATGEFLLGTRARLAGEFRLLCMRYEPGPSVPAGEDGYRVLARSVVQALGGAGVERPLILAESFGVGLALCLALEHPASVAGLALVNGFAHFAPKPWRAKLKLTTLTTGLLPGWAFDLGHRWLAPRVLFGPRYTPALRREFVAAAGGSFDAAYRERFAMIQGLDLRERLAELTLPIALFASDLDRVVSAVGAARLIAGLVGDASLTVLPRAGHMVLSLEEEPWLERMLELSARSERLEGLQSER